MTAPDDEYFLAMARARLVKRTDEAGRKLFWAVRPLLTLDEKEIPQIWGSSVLFTVSGRRFLISAAHVLDRLSKDAVYIGTDTDLVRLTGHWKYTEAPVEGRKGDKVDLAFLEVTDSLADELSACRFLTIDEVNVDESVEFTHGARSNYLALGYPVTKAKHDWKREKVIPIPMVVTGLSRDQDIYPALGVAEYSHILMEFNKRHSVTGSGVTTAPDPYGMSGGGMWRFDSLRGASDAPNRLVGILTEYHKSPVNALLATRISLCFEAMRGLFPELGSVLPRTHRVRVRTRDV